MEINWKDGKYLEHKDVTQKNGRKIGQSILESIEIKGVFLSERNPIVKLGLVIKEVWKYGV